MLHSKNYFNPYEFVFLPLLSDEQWIPGSPIFIPNADITIFNDIEKEMVRYVPNTLKR